MSATEQDKASAPLDPFGNEICLLFLKYGKCRYKKKCKKSHTLPDKDAPIMQKMTPVAPKKPVVKEGPKIAFTVKRTPYARPSTASTSTGPSTAPNLKRIPHQRQEVSLLDSAQREPPRQDLPHQERNSIEVTSASPTMHDSRDVPARAADQSTRLKEGDTGAMEADTQQPVQSQQEPKKQRKPKARRLPKVQFQCLLSSLFRTTISSETIAASRSTPSTTLYPGPPTKGRPRIDTNRNRKEHVSKPFATPAHATFSTNESEAADEKIENWYITYKARLEPKTRRLMVMTKPTTMRHQNQLKTMRKHHWECRTEIEQQLKRHVPMAFSLKIVRSRIDWERVAPYVTLMIQAAFEMDIQSPHLPVIGTTLCALLEHKDLGGLACEELLVSWGLTGIDARRFTSHLWEVMVAAAGEASVRGGKGFGMRIRQFEDKEDFKTVRTRLQVLNKAPT
ncbi:hypothetical protein BGX33_011489 [Mortierella sp. NVP41]|nr:hypothetical protein BGX33_011489 [Mortierella sp. NVP41]